MSKIMQIFYGNDCLPYKDRDRQVHYPIIGNSFSGASLVDEIRFYVKDITDNDTIWVANAKRADGQIAYKQLEFETDTTINEKYVALQLSQWFTAKKGDLYIALNGYKGGVDIQVDSDSGLYTISGTPIIQATGSVKLAINYAPIMNNGYGEIPQVSVQEALGLISTKLDKGSPNYVKYVDDIDNLNTSAYEHYVFANDIVLARDNVLGENELYVVGGLYPNLTLTSLPLYVSQLTGQTINASDIVISNSGTFPTTSDIIIGSTTLKSLLDAKADLSYVQSAIETIKQEEYVLADYITYPTLQTFLDNFSGEEGHIYLYPINVSEAPDFTSGFYKYIYETDSGWISLGTTDIDLNDYYTKTESDEKFATLTGVASDLSLKADKVGALPYFSVNLNDSVLTFIDNNSINRKPIILNVSFEDFVGNYKNFVGQFRKNIIGPLYMFEFVDLTTGDIYSSSIPLSISTYTFANIFSDSYRKLFEQQKNKITTINSSSTDTQYPSAKCVWDNLQNIREVADGKCKSIVISYQQTLTPIKNGIDEDLCRAMLYNSNTKEFDIDISSAVLNGDYDEITIFNNSFNSTNAYIYSGDEWYLLFIHHKEQGYDWHFIRASDFGYFFNTGDNIYVQELNVPDRWFSNGDPAYFYVLETSKVVLTNFYDKTENLIPNSSNTYDLGSSSYTFKDLYLGGSINIGSNKIEVDQYNQLRFGVAGGYPNLFYGSIIPMSNNVYDLGSSTLKFKNLWANNLKGVSTLTQAQYDALVSGGTVDSDTFYFIEEE